MCIKNDVVVVRWTIKDYIFILHRVAKYTHVLKRKEIVFCATTYFAYAHL